MASENKDPRQPAPKRHAAYWVDINPGRWHLRPFLTHAGPSQWTFYFLCIKVTKSFYA